MAFKLTQPAQKHPVMEEKQTSGQRTSPLISMVKRIDSLNHRQALPAKGAYSTIE
jgi:hypothetical protein